MTHRIILVNMHVPNDDNPNFYEELGKSCEGMGKVPFIIQDSNIVLNGLIDTVNYVRENNTRTRNVKIY